MYWEINDFCKISNYWEMKKMKGNKDYWKMIKYREIRTIETYITIWK